MGLLPRASQMAAADAELEPLPPTTEGLTPFPREDKRLLETIFQEHLPQIMVERQGGQPEDYLRPAQWEVAQRIADNFGRSGLLLVHAPTGTGKTLAYVVPALLWSLRHNLRVGVATYTRALQEQAMEGEVPRALQALARAGIDPLPRVALLKGRENYLCWRAFTPQTPEPSDDGETWLAWTALLTFAMTDEFGDLDRLDANPPMRLATSQPYRDAIARLLRVARARKGCCSRPKDRATCMADLARRRAERSHLVITNQSFVLARQEFLRHVVFDECEHLHDGAVSAWSHRFDFEETRRTLGRLHRPGRGRSRAPLDRLQAQLPVGGGSREIVDRTLGRWEVALRALHRLEEEAEFFDRRRVEETAGRGERELHGYLRSRVQQGGEAGLLQTRFALGSELALLERELDRVLEVCDANAMPGQAAIRRQLELGRTDLIEAGKSLDACIPWSDSGPSFAQEVFYDVERRVTGSLGLVARVLLPFESLGRFYYPDLASAAFVSATTYLAGSFDSAKGYLGLQRAEQPAEEEERVGRPVEVFR
ncbi:MAG TPA: hypothetical protein P5218_14030, partial [Planctomycetota bacterium]|nr:hypothetical protein [Planctomycetota bacterium]